MFDGLKIKCNNTPLWEQSGRLHFVLSVEEQTGEISSIKQAKYKGLTFKIVSRGGVNTYLCLGSIHRYKNGGGLNDDSFNYSDVKRVLTELRETYGIDLHASHFLRLEFGVNLSLDFKPQRIINSAVSHRGTPFVSLSRRCLDYGAVCSHNDYEIKLYDKAYRQKTKRGYLLRVEMRTLRTRVLSTCGVNCLADLLRLECWESLKQMFVEKLREIVFIDLVGFKKAPLTVRERGFIATVSNSQTWKGFNKKQSYRARLKYADLLQKYSLLNISELLPVAVANEIEMLSKNETNTTNILNTFLGTNSHFIYMLESVPNGDGLNNKKIDHCDNKKVMVNNNNKFNLKSMEYINKKHQYFTITYGGKKVRETVTLERKEINTNSYWASRVIEIKDLQTERTIKGKRAISWVKLVSKINVARLKKEQRKENIKQIEVRIKELAQYKRASLESIANSLGVTRLHLEYLTRKMKTNVRRELANARAQRVERGYLSGLTCKQIATMEKITIDRVRQILLKRFGFKFKCTEQTQIMYLKGFTQQDIALCLGVNRGTVWRWVKLFGLNSVSSDGLYRSSTANCTPFTANGLHGKNNRVVPK